MRHDQIEAWALDVVDRVTARQPVEDDRVELKRDWPDDPGRAARRIAGHLNAGRGASVLWIVGVDEQSGAVPGADLVDSSSWWTQVSGRFDEIAPEAVFLNVPTGTATVVAILFSTDRPPLVTKNPSGGSVQLEVPWREGTSTRSARRSDLMRILVPATRLPAVEVRAATVWLHPLRGEGETGHMTFPLNFAFDAYLEPATPELIVLPTHRTSAVLRDVEGQDLAAFVVRLEPGGMPVRNYGLEMQAGYRPPMVAETISQGAQQLLVQGPGLLHLSGRTELADILQFSAESECVLHVTIGVVGAATALVEAARLVPVRHNRQVMTAWGLKGTEGTYSDAEDDY